MIKYLHKVIKEFPERITGSATTPAADHLFQVWEYGEAKLIEEKRDQQFHTTVFQLLFLSSRARQDIQTAVAFLNTQVKKPDEDDWDKLRRVLKYLNGTKYMKIRLSVNNMSVIEWFVDASDRKHMDCKGNTGAYMNLGKGDVTRMSTKHKSNTKSLTES